MSLGLVTFGIISFITCGLVSSLPEQNQWTTILKSVRCLCVCARVNASVGCDGRGTLHVSTVSLKVPPTHRPTGRTTGLPGR